MARPVQIFGKKLDQISEIFDLYTTTLKRAPELAPEETKSPLDAVIQKWAQKRRTMIAAIYTEENVRYINFVGDNGEKAQISVSPPPPQEKEFFLRAWDMKSRRKDFTTEMKELPKRLDEAFSSIRRWIHH